MGNGRKRCVRAGVSTGLMWGCALVLVGCGDGDGAGEGDAPLSPDLGFADGGTEGFGREDYGDFLESLYDIDGSDGYDDYFLDDEDAPPPFSRKFDGLVANRATWGAFEVDLVAARIERGKDEYWNEGGWDGPYADDVYVEIDVGIANPMQTEEDLRERSTWDLILADGTRLRQSSTLAVLLAPGDRTVVTLRHLASEGVALAGASLELNGATRGKLHPERIPLDAPYAPDLDLRLVKLEGETMESSVETLDDRRRLEVVEARVSRNSALGWRAEHGQVLVELDLKVTALSYLYVRDADFGIVVDGALTRPDSDFGDIYAEGTTHPLTVTFSIPDDTREFDLRFMLSDAYEPDMPEWAERHVDLDDAEPAGS